MDNLFWAVAVGFGVTAFLLYFVVQELAGIRGHLETIEKELGWKGTIHKQLLDLENALQRN
jgi:hypothetical protein